MAEGMILNAAFFFSLAAAAAGAAAYVFRRPQFAKAAPPAMALSWLALSAGLLLLWLRLGRPPLSNQYESLLTMLWLLFPLAFYFYRRSGRPEALPAAALAACVLFGAAALLDKTARPLMPALRAAIGRKDDDADYGKEAHFNDVTAATAPVSTIAQTLGGMCQYGAACSPATAPGQVLSAFEVKLPDMAQFTASSAAAQRTVDESGSGRARDLQQAPVTFVRPKVGP